MEKFIALRRQIMPNQKFIVGYRRPELAIAVFQRFFQPQRYASDVQG